MNATSKMALAAAMILIVSGAPALANNLAVTSAHLRAPAEGKVQVRFDISWKNSWRDGINWDAAWVFVKYSLDGGTNWAHATLSASGTNPDGFSGGTGTNLDVVVPADKKGAFLQRAVEGTGSVGNTNVTLLWDFATNGVSRSKSALVKVFAVEMVYIPQGAFWAGNTNGVINSSFRAAGAENANSPFYIDSTNEFTIYWGTGAGTGATVSNMYPNGYAAFYLMKTEISQRQYCDFLNTLTALQQGNRHDNELHWNSNRNFIKRTVLNPLTKAYFGCDANNNAGPNTAVTKISCLNETNDGEWVACNYLIWMDGCAYADWAGLRPFTELEFEKACRGNLAPVANEYAWGDADLESPLTTGMAEAGTASETPSNGNCNIKGCWGGGPYRCGCYARASSGRSNAGAGYYGVLDLSGNLWERTVTVGNETGRAFTGEHGDGALTSEGYADVIYWPGADATGIGFRGGFWNDACASARMFDRYSAAAAAGVYASRNNFIGFRGARSAPSGVGP